MAQVGAVGAQAGKIELLSQRPNAREVSSCPAHLNSCGIRVCMYVQDKFMGGGDQKILDILDAVNICNMNFCKLAPFLGNTALNIGILQVSYEMGSFNTQDFYRKPDSLWKALRDHEHHEETDNYLFTTSLFFELLNGNIVTTGTAQQMPTGDYTSNAPVKTRRYAEQGFPLVLISLSSLHVAHGRHALWRDRVPRSRSQCKRVLDQRQLDKLVCQSSTGCNSYSDHCCASMRQHQHQ